MRLCPGLGPCDLPSEVVSGLCLSSELAQVTLILYLWHWLAPASPWPFPEVPASLPGAHVPRCVHTSQCVSGQPRPSSAPPALGASSYGYSLGAWGLERLCLSSIPCLDSGTAGAWTTGPGCVRAWCGADRPEGGPCSTGASLCGAVRLAGRLRPWFGQEYNLFVLSHMGLLFPHRHALLSF